MALLLLLGARETFSMILVALIMAVIEMASCIAALHRADNVALEKLGVFSIAILYLEDPVCHRET